MCGIAGILSDSSSPADVGSMAAALTHRGPDDYGIWNERGGGVCLAHRRLSILDLSERGHQPMASPSGRFQIVFNGEIYNHSDLRNQLQSMGLVSEQSWRGHSDTETLVAGFDAYGVERTLKDATGMFAIAVWDRRERVLWLARDRVGEKPLYYFNDGSTLAFASELKAFLAVGRFNLRISREALGDYLRYGYVPGPRSIFDRVHKVQAATYVKISLDRGRVIVQQPSRYWTLPDQTANANTVDDQEAAENLHGLLRTAVGRQMLADVPLGAFLSGGVDSSLIVALMQAQSVRPVRTFTIGFRESSFDEAPFAREVAAHLGTDHTELYVTPAEAASVLPELPAAYDEPFADSSQVPTLILARLTRKHVKVSLSGDGGDELFAGYPRYRFAEDLWKGLRRVPVSLRKAAGAGFKVFSPDSWDRLFSWLIPPTKRSTITGHRVHRLADIMTSTSFEVMYEQLMAQWQHPSQALLMEDGPRVESDTPDWGRSLIERMRYRDLMHYLPDDILVKVDRATMVTSLESRAPLLDHRVVEYAFSLPRALLIRNDTTKWLLREVLYRFVPKHLIERPKAGFGIPLTEWLRGPLRDWAESLLSEGALRNSGVFRPSIIRRMWEQHLSGTYDRQARLWSVLMFQAWHAAVRRPIA